jgi:hypothetical protein
LLKLGIGSGILKKLDNAKENLKTKARLLGSFSLDDFIKGNKHFLKFQGSTTEYPCGQGTWLVLYDTIPISENQLIEFPQVLRYSSKSAEASQQIFQNISPELKFDKLPVPSVSSSRIFTNEIVESRKLEVNFKPNFIAHDSRMTEIIQAEKEEIKRLK